MLFESSQLQLLVFNSYYNCFCKKLIWQIKSVNSSLVKYFKPPSSLDVGVSADALVGYHQSASVRWKHLKNSIFKINKIVSLISFYVLFILWFTIKLKEKTLFNPSFSNFVSVMFLLFYGYFAIWYSLMYKSKKYKRKKDYNKPYKKSNDECTQKDEVMQ